MTIFVIRLLSPDDYGLMAKATVCIGFMMMISELGLTAAIIQVKDLGDREISQTYGFVIATNCVMMILLCTGAPLISNFFGDARLIRIYQVLSLVFMISSVYIVPQSLLMRRMNFRSKAAIDLIAALVGSATTLVTALTGFKVWSLVWGLLANQVALAVGYNMLSGRLFCPLSIFQDLEKCFLSEVLSVVAEFYGTYIPVQTCLSEADSLKARILVYIPWRSHWPAFLWTS